MDLLADVAANTKASRLYRALVYERRLATEVMALQHSREMAGFWQIVATAAPGHTLEELDAAITVELCRLLDHGPSDDEVERGRAQAEAHFVFRLQTLGGFGGKSDQLNAYHVFLNDPGYFERDLARYRSLEAGDLRDAAQQFLPNQRRVALSVVPRGRASEALSGSVPAVLP
jgi:zinc protease